MKGERGWCSTEGVAGGSKLDLVAKRTETCLLTSFHSRTGPFSIQAYLPPPPPLLSLSFKLPPPHPHLHQATTVHNPLRAHPPPPPTHTQYLYTFSSTQATTKQSLTLLNHIVRSFDRQLSEENLASLKSEYFFVLELVSLA